MHTKRRLFPFSGDPETGAAGPGRKKYRGGRIFAWPLLGLICLLVAALAIVGAWINSGRGHAALLQFARQQATKALGVPVQIQNFAFHWGSLSLDIYGIEVAGAGPRPDPPLLRVRHAEVSVRIVSFFKREWNLNTVRIDQPIVWIEVDKNGVSNLPKLTSTSASSGNNNLLFSLGIRHAIVDGGEVYYNSVPRSIEADLHTLDLRAAFTPARQMYSGSLAYSDGRLRYGGYHPVAHNLALNFSLTPTAFAISRAQLAVGNSTVLLAAAVDHYLHDPAIRVDYQVSLDGAEMAQLLGEPSIPEGIVRAAGTMHFDDIPGQPMVRTLTVNGDLTSNRLNLKTASMSAAVSNLAAHYAVANGNAALQDFHANVLGGDVTAQGTMIHLDSNDAHSSFSAELCDISLAQLKRMAGNQTGAKSVALAGTLNATATATWGKTMNDLVAQGSAELRADLSGRQHAAASPGGNAKMLQVASTQTAGSAVLPIDGQIHAVYTRAKGGLQLTNSYLRTAQTRLTMDGTVSRDSSLAVRLQVNDLGEVTEVVDAFRAPSPNRKPLNLSGTASFNGTVTGSTSAPRLKGQLAALNVRINQSVWKSIHAGVEASPDHASLQNAVLAPAAGGRIEIDARAGLKKWVFSKQSPIQARVTASRISVADLAKFIAHPPPVTGTLDATLNVHGSAANPEGNGNLSLTGASAYRQPIDALRVNFSGNGAEAQADLTVRLPGGSVRANVTVRPTQRTYTAEVTSPGIELSKLTAITSRNIEANGVLQLHASGQGSFSNPELVATVRIPTLTVSKQTISAVNLQVNVANHVAHAVLNSSTLDASIQATASVQLTGDYMADATLNTPVLNLKPLLALYAPSQAQNISGQTQIQATLHGPVRKIRQIEAHVMVPVLNLAYQDSIHLAEVAPIQVNYKDGDVHVQPGEIRGTGTALTFEAHVPTNRNLPMSLRLGGSVNLQLAELVDPGIHSSGLLKLNINSHEPMTSGQIAGEIDVVDASFSTDTMPVGLQHGNGVLKLTTERVNIASFEGTVGGGTVQLRGGVAYRPHLVFDLALAASGVRMLYPQGLRETLGANLRLNGSSTNALLTGTVDLTNLSFTPGFDLSSFARGLSGGVAAPPSQGGLAQNVRLNLAVRSTNNIELVSRQLSVNGAANLQVRGTAAQPVILGRVDLTGGDVILNGHRFLLAGGTIQFINPSRTEPRLNLAMTTTIQQYDIRLRFRGPAQQIHAEYTSNPALPTADIIHLLAFGQTTEAAANNVTPANQQAESLVASQVASQVTSRISKVAGISQLSVSPVLRSGTQQGPPGATVTIRQRVTGNLFITFSTNVASTQDQVIQGEYKISPKVSFSATRDPNGGFGFDTLIKNSW